MAGERFIKGIPASEVSVLLTMGICPFSRIYEECPAPSCQYYIVFSGGMGIYFQSPQGLPESPKIAQINQYKEEVAQAAWRVTDNPARYCRLLACAPTVDGLPSTDVTIIQPPATGI